MDRRQFLTTLAAGALLLPAATLAGNARRGESCYFSARASLDGRYFISGFDAAGRLRFDTPLPGRGHALAVHPGTRQLVAAARRPGTFLQVMDADSGAVLQRLESRPGRHFYGHSLFSADGRRLYTTENDLRNDQGVIGVRDVDAGYALVDEFPTHGIGPHELRLLGDGRTLVVANGGILTRPETGRTKLNLETMSPSLVYLDAADGALLEQHRLAPELHRNSIRHLAVNRDDQVCFVMQYQGDAAAAVPLVGLHRRGQAPQLLQAPAEVTRRMHRYCGSACADPSGEWFAVSSPRGNLVTFWAARDGAYAGLVEIADGCGLAAGVEAGEFLLSSGQGGVYRYHLGAGELRPLTRLTALDARWDNHLAGAWL